VDSPAESLAIAGAYGQRLGRAVPLLLDAGGSMAMAFDIDAYPTTILVDAVGTVRAAWTGEVSAGALRRALTTLVAR
jgi:hypothetical protein